MGEVVIADTRSSTLFVIGAILLISGALLLIFMGEYSRTEKVPALVTTSIPSVKVYPSSAGILEEIFVENGTHVLGGAALAVVRVDRLDSALNGSASERVNSLDSQIAILRRSVVTLTLNNDSDVQAVRDQLNAISSQTSSLSKQILLQQQMVVQTDGMTQRLAPLMESGYISRIELERRRHEALVIKQQLEQLIQQRAQMHSLAIQNRAKLVNLPLELQQRLGDLQLQLERVKQERAIASVQVAYTIVAPISGTVTSRQAALGRVVDGSKPILTLMPSDTVFEVSAYIPTRAAAFVRPGQKVELMYDALPYRKFGSYEGEIVEISHSALAPEDLDSAIGLKEPVYVARILPSPEGAPPGTLQAGMTLTVNIVLEKRTVLQWILEPINTLRHRMRLMSGLLEKHNWLGNQRAANAD